MVPLHYFLAAGYGRINGSSCFGKLGEIDLNQLLDRH